MPLPPYERGTTRRPLGAVPAGLHGSERSTFVPVAARAAVSALIGGWELKRRAGFEVPGEEPLPGAESVLGRRMLGIRFTEPVRVVWADASGFGYETRPGHPLYGEESFVLDDDGVFTARSVSRPSTWFWWLCSPALRVLQRSASRRYVRVVEAEAAAAG